MARGQVKSISDKIKDIEKEVKQKENSLEDLKKKKEEMIITMYKEFDEKLHSYMIEKGITSSSDIKDFYDFIVASAQS